ncbi:amino acid adenylation enzyme/thioester reductase family protein [Xenococcus sp. PCC 7305]|uniref:non-ribosomal peptide synthetase n=1 Tax=Xenococcus sp. PCC 7305 TaxID=102125 RepID=UPI0002AD0C63|nr:non-ribosomal peptide synthetase [Xenococcus sp. PCC 7305]ELS00504.1 amino acid adenylation enzyme/thioester reductase family protein [Xenococcus sp. PCC 7305]
MATPTLTGFGLSPQQKRLWRLQQDDAAYLTQGAIAIAGNLQTARLKQVVEQIVARHQILRTNFSRLPGVKLPVMTIADRSGFWWQEIDFRERDLDLEELFEKESRQAYDLETEASLRLALYQVSATNYILKITLPALSADYWTLKNLFNEIADGYGNYQASQSAEEIQYVQFSEWQNQLLSDEDATNAEKFWQEQRLNSFRLPFENHSVGVSRVKMQTLDIAIAEDLITQLETIAQKYQTKVSSILLACWQILIWRLTDESSIAIGTYCDRREYEEMHSIMGLLATCLPIKSDLTGDLTFAEVIANLEQTLESVLEWQDYFSLKSDDDLVFPIGFEFQELPSPQDLGALTFSLLKQSSSIERHKLQLSGIRRQNSLFIEINYDRGYFSPETIDSLARQLQALLGSATTDPECKIEELSILDARDRERIFHEFNQTTKDYPQGQSIQQLFAEQAQKTPHEIAVVFEEQQLTYAQLNSQANQLAHYLRERGVKPEVLVGLYLEKSSLSIVGLLGILKAGGAYLPLDANLPKAALGDRLDDVQIVLTQQKLVSNLPQSIAEIICLDQDWQKIAKGSELDPSQETSPENLTYVLFTSGSTGKPKGVAIEQQQLLNYYYAICDRLHLQKNKSFALVSSLAADLGNTVIFPALLTGGCLHLIANERASNPEALADYCDRHTIDYLKIVPSHLNALLSAAQPEKILPRKGLILGGETLSWQLVTKIQQYQPHCQIFNHYGPTETTVGVLTYQVETNTDHQSDTVPIGKPLANNQVYILDKKLQPVPIGVPGELYIAGAQVSRGYLNQPELTAKKFIKNPLINIHLPSAFCHLPYLYKTGDRVRYLPNGNIEFLGRIDHQVKIRGYRIELGEIEFALQQHPQIKEAIAIARTDKTGKKRLVAYLVFEQQQSLNDQDLANFLQQKLPNYMIPAVWIPLKALPLTANGKVDRLALPAPEQAKSQTEKVFVAPRNPTEAILADIWAQVLEVTQVSIDDNFFELGGDSILSIQIIAKVNQAGFKATPKQIFEYPTVAGLAAKITPQDNNLNIEITSSAHDYKKFLPELQAKIAPELLKSLEDIYELTPIQKGILFHSLYDSTNGLYLFQDTFTIKASLNIETFVAAWQQVVQRHTILRTGFYWEDLEQPLQVVYQQVKLPFDYQDWQNIETEKQQEQLQSFLKRDRSRNFDLAQPCPMRLTFFRLADDIYELVWTRHFIVADGWSVPLLLNEVVQIYQSIEEKREFSLAPSTPFRSYITWLNQQDPSQAKQFWQQMLAGIKRPTPINNLYIEGNSDRQEQYDDRQIALSPTMSRQLNTFVKQHHLTLNTLIQGVWAILLSHYSNQTEVLYGCTVSGRPPELEGVESIAGMLLNTLPVRVKVEPEKAILPWLKQLQKLLVEIRQYEYSPLVEVKAWSEIPPGLPLFESIVVFENLPQPESLRDEKRALEIIDFNTFYKINYPITVVVVPSFPLLVGVNYNFNLVDAGTIDGILTHFKMLLNFIMDNPDRCLQDISLVTKEQQKIIAMLEQQVTFNFDNSA